MWISLVYIVFILQCTVQNSRVSNDAYILVTEHVHIHIREY